MKADMDEITRTREPRGPGGDGAAAARKLDRVTRGECPFCAAETVRHDAVTGQPFCPVCERVVGHPDGSRTDSAGSVWALSAAGSRWVLRSDPEVDG